MCLTVSAEVPRIDPDVPQVDLAVLQMSMYRRHWSTTAKHTETTKLGVAHLKRMLPLVGSKVLQVGVEPPSAPCLLHLFVLRLGRVETTGAADSFVLGAGHHVSVRIAAAILPTQLALLYERR